MSRQVSPPSEESAAIVLRVLQGEAGPARDVVLANAGATLVAADKADTIAEGVAVAARSIDDGSAVAKLDALIELSQKLE